MNKTLSVKDRFFISVVLTFMVLSSFFTFMFINIEKFNPIKYHEITGIVHGYTVDSVYVDVNWLVEYDCTGIFSDLDHDEMDIKIKDLMKKEIIYLLSINSYYDICKFKKQKLKKKMSGVKVIIFNH